MAGRKKPYISSKVYDKMISVENMNVDRKKKKNKKKSFKSAGGGDGAKELGGCDNAQPPTSPAAGGGNGTPFREKRAAPYYKPYMLEEKAMQGIQRNELFKGTLRINQRNTQEAYIDGTARDGFPDYLVLGVRDRNRALNGDVVIVRPKTRDNWVLRTSVFRRWKHANNIGNHFEMSLNNELYDAVSIGSESTTNEEVEAEREADEQEADIARRLAAGEVSDGSAITATMTTPKAKKTINNNSKKTKHSSLSTVDDEDEKEEDDFSSTSSSFDSSAYATAAEEGDEEVGEGEDALAMIRLAMKKLDEKRTLEKVNLQPAKTYKYDRKQILRYRRRVPANYCPSIADEVKSSITKSLTSKTSKHSFPFQFVGNFNKNDEIPDFLLIRTCEVVFISEKKLYGSSPFTDCDMGGRARAAGRLARPSDELLLILSDHYPRHSSGGGRRSSSLADSAIFTPSDTRLPKMVISPNQLPADFARRPADFANCIFVAEMSEEWSPETSLARGRLLQQLGEFGDVRAETDALLMTNNIDTRPFPRDVLLELEEHFPVKKAGQSRSDSMSKKPHKRSEPVGNTAETANFFCKASAFKIKRKVLESRKDFRFTTVFTIDPALARDLDDALHVQRSTTTDGRPCWEVGVHIADVSYFVQPGSKVDTWARRRGTSVYLVDEVIPMLPRVLCEELCSLNPNEDRLTFSVVWKMDNDGHILEEWFGRSVIRSCVKLAYEHAQSFIDSAEETEWSLDTLPPIFYTNRRQATEEDGEAARQRVAAIRDCVLQLNRLAAAIRRRRFDSGALRLDAPKLKIRFSDAGHKYPCGVCLDERSDANFLVEEFMLLANMAVARRIADEFPDVALLRRHPSPKASAFEDAVKKCERIGFPLGAATSSKEISEALRNYESRPELRRTVLPILFQYMLRSMQLAVYFCSGVVKSEADYRHFALNVDRYTHFTSPIRRYPDLVVHRLLSACLGYRKKPTFTPEQVEAIAKHCNATKTAAKAVSDGSAEIFFNAFIKETGRFEAYGIVTMVYEHAIEVMLLEFGIVEIIAFRKMPEVKSAVFQRSDNDKNEKGRSGSVKLTLCVRPPAAVESVVKTTDEVPTGKRTRGRKAKGTELAGAATVTDSGDTQTTEMVIKMLSIVKVALVPDRERPGKHFTNLVATPEAKNLTISDLDEVIAQVENEVKKLTE